MRGRSRDDDQGNAMGRNIVLCFDGTSNKYSYANTNTFLLIEGSHELDCTFVENRNLAMIPTNEIYNKVIGKYCKMEGKSLKCMGLS